MHNKLSNVVDRMLSQHIIDDKPDFVTFIKKFFEYAERNGGQYDLVASLRTNGDIDTTAEEYLKYYKSHYGQDLPVRVDTDLRVFLKRLRTFYLSKGSEKSFKFLFRSLYDASVSFYYPKVDILRASAGNWINPYYLRPVDNSYNSMFPFIDKYIQGNTSGARGYVNKIVFYEPLDGDPLQFDDMLSVIQLTGSFSNGETISVVDGDETAILESVDGINEPEGQWEGTDGFISWDKFLQDNDKYQDYSYVIESEVSPSLYTDTIQRLVHPAGFKMFSEVGTKDIQPEDTATLVERLVVWMLEWIGNQQTTVTPVQSLSVTYDGGTSLSTQLNYSDFILLRETDWFERQYSLSSFDYVPIGSMELNENSSSLFLSKVGVKLNALEYTTVKNIITFSTPPAAGEIIFANALTNNTYAVESFTGVTGSFTPVDTNLIVFVDGILTTDWTESGGDITINNPVLTGSEYIELMSLNNENIFDGYGIDISGDGSTTIFSHSAIPAYMKDGHSLVFVDGLTLRQNEHYRCNDGEIIFTTPPPLGTNNINIYPLYPRPHRLTAFAGNGVADTFQLTGYTYNHFRIAPEIAIEIT